MLESSTPAGGDSQDVILWGVKEIAREIGRTERQAYWLLQKGYLPADKFGRIWASTRRRLRGRFEGQPGPKAA